MEVGMALKQSAKYFKVNNRRKYYSFTDRQLTENLIVVFRISRKKKKGIRSNL